MAREDHVYVNLDVKFVEKIDVLVTHVLWNGAQKYRSRRDFIITACQKLIDEESKKAVKKGMEVSA